jgi:hypothetical protein
MGRIEKVTSRTDRGDDMRSERDQIDRLLARLRWAADDHSVRSTPESTLVKRYAAFTPTGDLDTDLASLAELEQEAMSLLRKRQKERRDRKARRSGGATLGSR